jgi:hypothetical protein
MRWPRAGTREHWEFVFKAVQSVAVVIGVLWAAYTFWDTRNRELRKPYEEKKLAFYTDAARVLAHLAAAPDSSSKAETETQFWELFWGELPFVESNDIKQLMERFCNNHFQNRPEQAQCSKSTGGIIQTAKEMSEKACRLGPAISGRDGLHANLRLASATNEVI